MNSKLHLYKIKILFSPDLPRPCSQLQQSSVYVVTLGRHSKFTGQKAPCISTFFTVRSFFDCLYLKISFTGTIDRTCVQYCDRLRGYGKSALFSWYWLIMLSERVCIMKTKCLFGFLHGTIITNIVFIKAANSTISHDSVGNQASKKMQSSTKFMLHYKRPRDRIKELFSIFKTANQQQ